MAFISLLFASMVAVAIVLAIGITSVIIGTHLYNKTEYKKLGIGIRIFGYITLIPSIVIIVLMAVLIIYFMRSDMS